MYSTKVIKLAGTYKRVGNKLTSSQADLLISNRETPTKKKSNKFLLVRIDGKYQYISSLYNDLGAPDLYNFDYEGVKYLLKLEAVTAKISVR